MKHRDDLGREKFLEHVWAWKEKHGGIIIQQLKKLGCSCDWTRERFTMDPAYSRCVQKVFVELYRKGLIYRGKRMVNWDPAARTALSDEEVEMTETKGHLWHLKYPLLDDQGQPKANEFLVVATTRPETMLGDEAVAVNPKDPRYQHIVGRRCLLPLQNKSIPVIADELVDPKFGTGCVKVTPAHDPADYDMALRHNLPLTVVIGPDGKMTAAAGEDFDGMDRMETRQAVVEELTEQGLLLKTEDYVHNVGYSQRSHVPVEPYLSEQWFLKYPSVEASTKAVEEGRMTFHPDRWSKTYSHWMQNLRDWCISRQLWWGHRIPVWYCADCKGLTVSVDEPTKCTSCGSKNIVQDPDVLDTWFSSGLWPHSTLGWPDKTEDLDYFYPTSVMETGYDIIFFWVSRMIMMGIENMGRVPFHTVYLHGLVRDEKGEKMSKVKGNVINPLDVIEKYGTDALRLSLSTGNSPGNDIRLSDSKMEASRNFCNKLWNASRFILGNIEEDTILDLSQTKLATEDRWILSRLNRMIANVDSLMTDFQFGEALRQIHDFVWGEFCDWYIEISKLRLKDKGNSPLPVLVHVLDNSLRLLHPAMPFITEEIWQNLRLMLSGESAESIMIASYPTSDPSAIDDDIEKQMAIVIDIVRAIRNTRSELHVEPAKWIEAIIAATDLKPAIEAQAQSIEILARARPLTIINTGDGRPDKAKTIVLNGAEVILPMSGMINMDAERTRLKKEIDGCTNEIARLGGRLADEKFTSKAPSHVVEREREKLGALKEKLATLNERLSEL
jgi:valyl-tRNA synthetase